LPDIDLYVRGAELGAEVELYEIDYSMIEGGSILYLTPSVLEGQTSLGFGGVTFTCHPLKLEGVQWDGQNAPSTPTFTIANLNSLATSLVDTYDDMIGAKVTRYRTYERYLDFVTGVTDPMKDMIGAEPDFEQRFPDEVYYFEQVKALIPGEAVVFVLSTLSNVKNKKIPGRNVIKRVCTRPYRRPDPANPGSFIYSPRTFKCPYVGSNYFDRLGNPTTADKDVCGRHETDCKLRFTDGPLPGYFFPSVAAARA